MRVTQQLSDWLILKYVVVVLSFGAGCRGTTLMFKGKCVSQLDCPADHTRHMVGPYKRKGQNVCALPFFCKKGRVVDDGARHVGSKKCQCGKGCGACSWVAGRDTPLCSKCDAASRYLAYAFFGHGGKLSKPSAALGLKATTKCFTLDECIDVGGIPNAPASLCELPGQPNGGGS